MQVNDSYRGTLSSYCYVLMCIHLLQQRQPAILPCLQSLKPVSFQRWHPHSKRQAMLIRVTTSPCRAHHVIPHLLQGLSLLIPRGFHGRAEIIAKAVLGLLLSFHVRRCRTVGQWMCDYFDDVEQLKGFGGANKESLGELVWAFFEHWAWKHDYNNAVVSVRTGGFLTKSQKEWTRRVGNERHLVCIEVCLSPWPFVANSKRLLLRPGLEHALNVAGAKVQTDASTDANIGRTSYIS